MQFPKDLVTFTEENLNGKLSANMVWTTKGLRFFKKHRRGDQDFLVKIGGSPYRGICL